MATDYSDMSFEDMFPSLGEEPGLITESAPLPKVLPVACTNQAICRVFNRFTCSTCGSITNAPQGFFLEKLHHTRHPVTELVAMPSFTNPQGLPVRNHYIPCTAPFCHECCPK